MKQEKSVHKPESQCTSTVLMVRPAAFGFNEETAGTNAFQQKRVNGNNADIARQAIQEFDALVNKLKDHRIEVIEVSDTPLPEKPDAVFPNNWLTTHADGTIITYPMYSVIRRAERRQDILEMLEREYTVNSQYSFDHYEEEGKILEGTGSMILDRMHHRVYACISPRTDLELLEHFALLKQYRKVFFHAVDPSGKEIYHTNVIMAMGNRNAVVCLDCVPEDAEKETLIQSLSTSGKEIIRISWHQVIHFAGNMLQLKNTQGEFFWVMSQSAYESLELDQIKALTQDAKIISSPIPTIERHGGGSVRCMIAEIFLSKK